MGSVSRLEDSGPSRTGTADIFRLLEPPTFCRLPGQPIFRWPFRLSG